MSGGRLYSNSEVISPPSIACFCFMVKLVYLCAQSNQRARCPTSFTVIGWLYKTPVSNSLDNSPPSLLAGRRTEPLSDSMQMTTIDNQIFFSHALTSYGFKLKRLDDLLKFFHFHVFLRTYLSIIIVNKNFDCVHTYPQHFHHSCSSKICRHPRNT